MKNPFCKGDGEPLFIKNADGTFSRYAHCTVAEYRKAKARDIFVQWRDGQAFAIHFGRFHYGKG